MIDPNKRYSLAGAAKAVGCNPRTLKDRILRKEAELGGQIVVRGKGEGSKWDIDGQALQMLVTTEEITAVARLMREIKIMKEELAYIRKLVRGILGLSSK